MHTAKNHHHHHQVMTLITTTSKNNKDGSEGKKSKSSINKKPETEHTHKKEHNIVANGESLWIIDEERYVGYSWASPNVRIFINHTSYQTSRRWANNLLITQGATGGNREQQQLKRSSIRSKRGGFRLYYTRLWWRVTQQQMNKQELKVGRFETSRAPLWTLFHPAGVAESLASIIMEIITKKKPWPNNDNVIIKAVN